ncbi:MAG: hypothetical protein GEU68_05740 [Actinobacteria bacterium]|nr:hypothetical protein [Actinomycetota bacterium]
MGHVSRGVRLLACAVIAAVALSVVPAAAVTNQSGARTAAGLTPEQAAAAGMSGGISARGGVREATGRNPRRDRRRSRATSNALQNAALVAANLVGLGAFFWPFALPAAVGGERAHALDAPVILVMLLGCLGAVLFLQPGQGGMGPKAVALIGVLGAAMVALRLPGFIAGFSAMFIVVLVGGTRSERASGSCSARSARSRPGCSSAASAPGCRSRWSRWDGSGWGPDGCRGAASAGPQERQGAGAGGGGSRGWRPTGW